MQGIDMGPKIWVIVAASRPEHIWRVIANYREQEYENKALIVVENGRAIGAYDGSLDVDIRMRSKANAGAARNEAIAWLKFNHPGDYWVSMDDDDYYGASYLTEHAEAAERGTVRGKWAGWTKFNNEVVYFGNSWSPEQDTDSLLGATIGAYIDETPFFPDDAESGEELQFCARARRKGLKVKTLTSANFCASREGHPDEHTHRANDRKYWSRFGRKGGVRVEGEWQDLIEQEPPSGPLESYA